MDQEIQTAIDAGVISAEEVLDPTVAYVLMTLHNMQLLRHDAIEGFTAREWRQAVQAAGRQALAALPKVPDAARWDGGAGIKC